MYLSFLLIFIIISHISLLFLHSPTFIILNALSLCIFSIILHLHRYKESYNYEDEYNYAIQNGKIVAGTVYASNQTSGLGWIL